MTSPERESESESESNAARGSNSVSGSGAGGASGPRPGSDPDSDSDSGLEPGSDADRGAGVDPGTDHLSRISTMWTMLRQAHGEAPGDADAARLLVFERYGNAVYRYLRVSLRDADAADELFQDFALRFIRGDFHRADPERGKFRYFLKTALARLMIDHHRRKARRGATTPEPVEAAAVADEAEPMAPQDETFFRIWRKELMSRAWKALEGQDGRKGRHWALVLNARTKHPDESSEQLAARLGEALGRAVTPEWVRKQLHFARTKYAELLVFEVQKSMDHPSREDLERELIDLNLHSYCKDVLRRRDEGPGPGPRPGSG